MDEQLDFVLDRVTRHDQDRSLYKEWAERWVRMYKLDPGFEKPLKEAIAKGHEQVILPTPFNVVNLSQRLLSATPRIDVIPQDIGNRESEEYAEKCEKWLTAMWRQVNLQQRRNVLSDNIWNSLVYGRHVFDVRWIRDQLPSAIRKTAFPFSIRALRPTDVGIVQGPYTTEFAYHKYEAPILDVIRRWPELKETPTGTRLHAVLDNLKNNNDKTEDHMVCVIDYWATEPDRGDIWNGVIVEDEWAKEYKKTSYPMVPLIAGRGDYAVGLGDEFDGLSILHSIDGLWQYRCRLASQLATGLMWYFWPHFLLENENNTPFEDFDIVPGGQNAVPSGTKVQQVSMSPNVPLAEAVSAQLDAAIQQSTYPEVMFGMMPADLKSSYGIALLTDAAQGRIRNFQESLEQSLVHVNELVLALIEKKAGKDGVDIYGVSEIDNTKYRLNLNKSMINGVYHNEVHITPAMPVDDLQKVVQGKQLADGKYISGQQLRDKYLAIKSPTDETRRIALEEAMQSDEMRPYRIRKSMMDYYGEDEALTMIWEAGPQAQQALMPPPPKGYEWTMGESGRVELIPLPPPAPPTGLPEGPMGPSDGSGTPPPGVGPMPPGPPPAGPGMEAGGPPIQPPGVAGPMGGGIPPQLAGQIEGENLGMDPAMDPLMLDMILNQQGSPAEVMDQTIGLQP